MTDTAIRRPPAGSLLAGGKVVETNGLTKRYGTIVTAVDRLDLSVYRGEVYGFLGPNGAGKTTTLRMLLGLLRPTMGQASIAGFGSSQYADEVKRRGGLVSAGTGL